MASRGVNKVILIGNLGQDPEVRYMPSGGAVANITIATSETWRDKATGEQKEKPNGTELLCMENWQKWLVNICAKVLKFTLKANCKRVSGKIKVVKIATQPKWLYKAITASCRCWVVVHSKVECQPKAA